MTAQVRYFVAVALCFYAVICTVAAAGSFRDGHSLPHIYRHSADEPGSSDSAKRPAPTTVSFVIPRNETLSGAMLPDASKPDLVQIADQDFPSDEMMARTWKGQATIEVYLVSDIVNTVGNVTGSALYGTIYEKLEQQCPPRIGNNDHPSCYPSSTQFPIRYRKDGGDTAESLNQIRVVSSKFATNEIRRPLIGAIAGAYEAMTNYDRNCFRANDEAAGNRHCNVAIRAKVFTEDSWLSIALSSDIADDNDGSWHCCETRELIDAKLDAGPVAEFKALYPTQRSKDRLVECNMGCTFDQRSYNVDIDKALIDVKDIQKW